MKKKKVVFWCSGSLPGVCVSFVVGRGGAGPYFARSLPPPLLFLISFSAFHVPSGCSIPVCALSEVVLVAGGKSSSPTRISALHSSLTQVTKNFL